MKFKGHESFAIRRGWLYKGMKHVRERGDIFLAKDAMEELGLGSNMVKSLRYWMQATGLTKETSEGSHRVQKLTELGELICGKTHILKKLERSGSCMRTL